MNSVTLGTVNVTHSPPPTHSRYGTTNWLSLQLPWDQVYMQSRKTPASCEVRPAKYPQTLQPVASSKTYFHRIPRHASLPYPFVGSNETRECFRSGYIQGNKLLEAGGLHRVAEQSTKEVQRVSAPLAVPCIIPWKAVQHPSNLAHALKET